MTEITGTLKDLVYTLRCRSVFFMRQKWITTRLVAIFLVAFVCLNAGGALCVAYCQSSFETAHEPIDQHTQKLKSGHCDNSDQSEDGTAVAGFGSGGMDCCPMTISFVAGPVEKNSFSAGEPAMAVVANVNSFKPAILDRARIYIPAAYRGPPLDRRISRLKNCVIRI